MLQPVARLRQCTAEHIGQNMRREGVESCWIFSICFPTDSREISLGCMFATTRRPETRCACYQKAFGASLTKSTEHGSPLGVRFAEEMLTAHRVALDYVRPDRSGNMPALHAMTQKPLDSGRTDASKNVLSSTQSRLIEQIAGQQMTALGYQPTRKEYSPPKMRVLRLSTRWALSESSRIALSQIRAPYWALRRVVDSGRNALKELA